MTSRSRRLPALVRGALATALLVGAVAACDSSGDDATRPCAGPSLRVSAPFDTPVGVAVAAPLGSTVEAAGRRFSERCGSDGGAAVKALRLYVTQGTLRLSVAQVDAGGDDAGFEVTFGIPELLEPGPAQVVVTRSEDEDAPVLAAAQFVVARS